jgi:hypothetical protein
VIEHQHTLVTPKQNGGNREHTVNMDWLSVALAGA